MNWVRKNKSLIFGILVGAILVYLIADLTTEKKLSNLQLSLDTAIDESYQETVKQVELIGQGILTDESKAIIADCKVEERTSFEEKLNRLDVGLSKSDLQVIDTLFSRCAPVQPVRRSLMVMDLSTKIQTLEGLVQQRKQVSEYTKYDGAIVNLKLLLANEQKISEVSFALVYLQREIIDLLMSGKSVSSDEANKLKAKGVDLRQSITKITSESILYRAKLSTP